MKVSTADVPPLVVFLHVPKAGGSVISLMLQKCLAARYGNAFRVCPIGSGNPFDHVCERDDAVIERTRRNVFSRFLNRTVPSESRCHFLETHHDYSLLSRIREAAAVWSQPLVFVTALREPVARTFSGWYFTGWAQKYMRANMTESEARKAIAARDGSKAGQKYGAEPNHMTKQLWGGLSCSTEPAALRDGLARGGPLVTLELAKANLRAIPHVLVYEQLDRIGAYLSCAFGCRTLPVPASYAIKGHASAPHVRTKGHEPAVWRKVVASRNELDQQLFEYASLLVNRSACASYPATGVRGAGGSHETRRLTPRVLLHATSYLNASML